MKEGRDVLEQRWVVRQPNTPDVVSHGGDIVVEPGGAYNDNPLWLSKQGAIDFAAAILEEVGETKLAETVRNPKPAPTRKDIALFILRTIGEYPAEFFAAYGVDAYRQLADGIHKMFVKEQGAK